MRIELRSNEPNPTPVVHLGSRTYRWQLDEAHFHEVAIDFNQALVELLQAYRGFVTDALRAQLRAHLAGFLPPELLGPRVGAAPEHDQTLLIETNATELFALPWEDLWINGNHGTTLGERFPDLQLRYLRAYRQPLTPITAEGGRVCLAWSHGGGGVPLQAFRDMFTRLEPHAPARYAGGAWVDEIEATTLTTLSETLGEKAGGDDPYRVLHLLCHGVVGEHGFELALGAGPGAPETVSGEALTQALNRNGALDALRLIVLTVCCSADGGDPRLPLVSAALTLHARDVPMVVAWSQPVGQFDAFTLAEGLYRRLLGVGAAGGWEPVQDVAWAFRQTRAAGIVNQFFPSSAKLYSNTDQPVFPFVHAPFPGLDHFHAEDARFFVGRDGEVEAALAILDCQREHGEPRLVGVIGDSGAGKSSVLRAGIEAWLTSAGQAVVGPIQGDDVGAALDSLDDDSDVVVLLDQLEASLAEDRDEHWATVLAALSRRVRATNGRVSVVVALRSHHVQRFAALTLVTEDGTTNGHVHLLAKGDENVLRNSVLIGPPSASVVKAMICEPIRRAGLSVADDALVDQLVAQVAAEPGGLPLLQFALRAAWVERVDREISLVEDPARYLTDRAEALYAPPEGLGRDEKHWTGQLKAILLALIDVGEEARFDALRRRSREDLLPASDDEKRAAAEKVLAALVAERLVVVQVGPLYSVAHYELVRRWERLKRWVDEERAQLVELRALEHAARRWDESGRHRHYLKHRGTELDHAWALVASFDPDPVPHVVRSYMSACRDREKFIRRLITAAVAAALIAAVVVMAFLAKSTRTAEAAEQEAVAALAVANDERSKAETAQAEARQASDRATRSLEQILIERARQDMGDHQPDRALQGLATYVGQSREPIGDARAVIQRLFLLALARGADCIKDRPADGAIDFRWRSAAGVEETLQVSRERMTWCRADECEVAHTGSFNPVGRLEGDILVGNTASTIVRWRRGEPVEPFKTETPADAFTWIDAAAGVESTSEAMFIRETSMKSQLHLPPMLTEWIAVGAETFSVICQWRYGRRELGEESCPFELRGWQATPDARAWVRIDSSSSALIVGRADGETWRSLRIGLNDASADPVPMAWHGDELFIEGPRTGSFSMWQRGSDQFSPAFLFPVTRNEPRLTHFRFIERSRKADRVWLIGLADRIATRTWMSRSQLSVALSEPSRLLGCRRPFIRGSWFEVWGLAICFPAETASRERVWNIDGQTVVATSPHPDGEAQRQWFYALDDGFGIPDVSSGHESVDDGARQDSCNGTWCWSLGDGAIASALATCRAELSIRSRDFDVHAVVAGSGQEHPEALVIAEFPYWGGAGCSGLPAAKDAREATGLDLGFEPLDYKWLFELAEYKRTHSTDDDRDALDRVLRAVKAAAAEPSPGASDDTWRSVRAARFVLERWGACRTTDERREDVKDWRKDLYTLFDDTPTPPDATAPAGASP